MDKLEYIKERLQDYSTHKELVFKAKVSQSTIWNILRGDITPQERTIDAIHNFFKRREK